MRATGAVEGLLAPEPSGDAVASFVGHGRHLGHQMRSGHAQQVERIEGWGKGLMKVAEFIGEGKKASPFRSPGWGEVEHVGGVPLLPRDVVVMNAQKVARSVQRCLSNGGRTSVPQGSGRNKVRERMGAPGWVS